MLNYGEYLFCGWITSEIKKNLVTPANVCKHGSEIKLVLPELTYFPGNFILCTLRSINDLLVLSRSLFFYRNLPIYNEAMWKQDAIITGGKRLEKQSFDICRSHDCRGLVFYVDLPHRMSIRTHWALSYRELEHLCYCTWETRTNCRPGQKCTYFL